VTVPEPFSFDELLNQTDRQWAENTWEYAILYDSRTTLHRFPPIEIEQLLARTQAVGEGRPRGPVGVAIAARGEMVTSGLQLTKQAGPNETSRSCSTWSRLTRGSSGMRHGVDDSRMQRRL
jgi:hypothetical protein